MRKAKQVSISMTDQQKEMLEKLSKELNLSASRVIHLLTIYATYNNEVIERIKLLDAALPRSVPNEDIRDICNGNIISWEKAKFENALEIIKTKWMY